MPKPQQLSLLRTKTCFLEGRGDFLEWRDAARRFLLANVDPRDIDWHLRGERQGLFVQDDSTTSDKVLQQASAVAINVPVVFLRLAEAVVCHSDPSRFRLLYKLSYRLGQSDVYWM